MTQQNTHVTIVGAGLGGLCLAQGLKRRGIPFDVYEKDSSADSRNQGYRIRIDQTGQKALAACLPAHLNRLFQQTCAVGCSDGQCLDSQLAPIEGRPPQIWHRSEMATLGDTDMADRSAHRRTLREVLLSGIEEHVHFGRAFEHFEDGQGGKVTLHFAGGKAVDTSVLVAADGVNSVVRRQRLAFANPVDTQSACIYGKTFRTSRSSIANALKSGTSVVFANGLIVVVDAMSFRFPGDAVHLTPVEDYLYWAVFGSRESLGLDERHLQQADGATLQAIVDRLMHRWAHGIRALIAEADPSMIAALPIRSAERLEPWTASRVTMLGDAIHAMSPAGGLGANTALDDAARLASRLADAVAAASSLTEAVAAYEEDMRWRANRAIEASLVAASRLFGDVAVG